MVFYTASAGGGDDRAYRSAYVDGLRYLLAALDGHPIRRFLYTSSTGVYAQSGGEWVDEDSATEPGALLRPAFARGRAPAPSVALPGHGGAARGHLRARPLDGSSSGCAAAKPSFPAGRPSTRTASIATTARGRCGTSWLSRGRTHSTWPRTTIRRTSRRCFAGLAERLGVPPPRVDAAETGTRYGRTSNKRVRNARLLASGYRFRYPTFREGYGELIAGVVSQGRGAQHGATGD